MAKILLGYELTGSYLHITMEIMARNRYLLFQYLHFSKGYLDSIF